VPALVAYNMLTARIRGFASGCDDFCRELLNSLEEIPVRPAVMQRPAGPATPEAGREATREVDRGLFK
jgi:biopolymer transport protein TolQ